jgi:HEAT repeat protein
MALSFTLLAVALTLGASATPLAAQTQPGEIAGHKIRVPGETVNGTTGKLSEVEAEIVAGLPPQAQAERLLQYAISHHVGATDEIKARVRDWRGTIKRTDSYNTLEDIALNGADLRVRAAAIEIDMAIDNIAKTSQQVDALLQQIHANPNASRPQIWFLGALANRGVEAERIHEELRQLMRHSNDDLVRYQAVYAISYIGTDDTVQDLVEAFHHDPSSAVQVNGGGCGLAHCGMLTRAQRMLAIPGLLEMIDDAQLNPTTMSYAFRALREITDETLGDDSAAWRRWYAAHGTDTLERFRTFDRDR